MRGIRTIIGIVLIAAGALTLAYGGFTYTKETHDADLGPVEIQLKEKEHVNLPVWAGAAAIIAGAGVLLVRRRSG